MLYAAGVRIECGLDPICISADAFVVAVAVVLGVLLLILKAFKLPGEFSRLSRRYIEF